jgi:hypothetical protein
MQRGLDFPGCPVFPDHLKLNGRSRRRFRRKPEDLDDEFLRGEADEAQTQRRATSLIAFTRAGGTKSWRFRSSALQRLAVSGHGAGTG